MWEGREREREGGRNGRGGQGRGREGRREWERVMGGRVVYSTCSALSFQFETFFSCCQESALKLFKRFIEQRKPDVIVVAAESK